MKEAAGSEAGNVTVELELVAEVVSQQLESMLSVGNYDAVKLLLKPVQPATITSERALVRPPPYTHTHTCSACV